MQRSQLREIARRILRGESLRRIEDELDYQENMNRKDSTDGKWKMFRDYLRDWFVRGK